MSKPMHRFAFITGAVHAFLSVALGAFGAHIVKDRISADLMSTYQTATDYQMYHAIGLFIVAFASMYTGERPAIRYASRLFNFGIVIFSGSLYVLVLSGMKWLGAVTPIGGAAFLAGWICLLAAIRKN